MWLITGCSIATNELIAPFVSCGLINNFSKTLYHLEKNLSVVNHQRDFMRLFPGSRLPTNSKRGVINHWLELCFAEHWFWEFVFYVETTGFPEILNDPHCLFSKNRLHRFDSKNYHCFPKMTLSFLKIKITQSPYNLG